MYSAGDIAVLHIVVSVMVKYGPAIIKDGVVVNVVVGVVVGVVFCVVINVVFSVVISVVFSVVVSVVANVVVGLVIKYDLIIIMDGVVVILFYQ